jgi:hypothetical protein
VGHPWEWDFCGYNEIQAPRERYALIDYDGLRNLLGFRSMHDFAEAYRGWVEESLQEENHCRDGKWTECVAVGSDMFVRDTKEKLGVKAKGRKVVGKGGTYELRESPALYKGILGHKNAGLSPQNDYFWQDTI